MRQTTLRSTNGFGAALAAVMLIGGCTHHQSAPVAGAVPESTHIAVAAGAKSGGTAPSAVAPQPAAPAGAKPVGKPIAVAIKPGLLGAAQVTGGGDTVPRINPNTVGLAMCDPVCTGDASLADFGAGCTHWLHYYVAGQPQFSNSTMWASMYRAETELKRNDLRLSAPQAKQLFSILGVPFVAATTISGTAAQCLLSIQILRAPNGATVGAPVTCTGTQPQVAAALPKVAAVLAATLGLHGLSLPPGTLNTAGELTLIGGYGWVGERVLKPNQFVPPQMATLASRSPVATISALRGLGKSAPACITHSLNTYGDSTLLYPEARAFMVPVPADLPARRAAMERKWPRNCALAFAELTFSGTYAAREAALHKCARLNPKLPGVWQSLATIYGEEGNSVRGGRDARALSRDEWSKLRVIYGDWEMCALRVTRLDPLRDGCWKDLAESATFAGDNETADAAMQKGIATDPNDMRNYLWALEMYQPKWIDMPDRLSSSIDEAVRVSQKDQTSAVAFLETLKAENMLNRAPGLMNSTILALQQQCAARPSDVVPHRQLAYLMRTAGNNGGARTAFEAALKLDPNNAVVLQQYGDLLFDMQLVGRSIPPLEQAAKINPNLPRIHYDLGYSYKDRARYADATREFKKQLAQEPADYGSWLGLGLIAEFQGDWLSAYNFCERAARYNPELVSEKPEHLVPLLAYASSRLGKFDQARRLVEYAQSHGIEDGDGIALAAARLALEAKQYSEAADASRTAIREMPADREPHYLLGLALYKSGNKADAREEWTIAGQGNKNEWTVASAKALASMK